MTTYLWDETSLYGDVVLETTGGVNTSYTLAGTQLISQTRDGSTSYYLQDGQGSTRALTNSAGAVTDTYSYTAYGEIYNQTGTTANNYLYTGQQFDSQTNLYSLRARFYSPVMGRFLSQDTWAVNYSNPIELNRYGVAANRPITLSDPSGNYALTDYAILLGGIGGATFGAVSDIACGGNGFTGAASGFVMGIGFTAIALLNPQAALAIGAFGAGTSIVSGSLASADMLLHGPNTCNSTQLSLAILGLFLPLTFRGGTPPSQQLAMNNGLTTGAQALSELVVVGNVVTTVGEVTGVLSLLMSAGGGGSGGNGGNEGVYIPKPGELAGQGRTNKTPPNNRTRGIYEFFDQLQQKWYTGETGDLYTRLRTYISQGRLRSWEDAVWTELKSSSGKGLRAAERARYEQLVEMVGGEQNMANDGNLLSREATIQWFDEGWYQNIPDWPNWLISP